MRTKISFALIGLACIVLIITAVYLGALNGTEILVVSAIIGVAMVAGFHLMNENGDKKQAD